VSPVQVWEEPPDKIPQLVWGVLFGQFYAPLESTFGNSRFLLCLYIMTRIHRHKKQKQHRVLVAQKKTKPRLVDRLTYVAAIVEPIITLPQVYQIFRDRSASGVSISAWIGYELLTLVWLWYGIVHKERMIIIYSALYAVVQLGVILGALLYGGKWI
jgi:uncharacterized protein with PQ loop repeat